MSQKVVFIPMNQKRIGMLIESLNALNQEVSQSLIEENFELFHYHLLRAYRLSSKPAELNNENLSKQFDDYFMKWHQQAAQLYESKGLYDESKREWLAAISQIGSRVNHEPFIQYAHMELKSQNLNVTRDIKDLMPYITVNNFKDILLSLNKAKFSLKAASSMVVSDSTNYMIAWIDQLQKAIENREDLQIHQDTEPDGARIQDLLQELDSFIGLEAVKLKIREICNLVTFNKLRQSQGFKAELQSLHMVFTGNPGTGKTTIARMVARILKALGVLKKGHLVEVGRADLVGEYVGQTAVKTMGKIKEARGGVLFIDEAYSLVRGSQNDFGIEAIDTIVKEMEDKRSEFIVILAGYPKEMKQFIQSNPGLHSRFKNQILFEDYSLGELVEISRFMFREKQYRLTNDSEAIFKKLLLMNMEKNPTNHGNARLVRNLIEEAILCKATLVVSEQEQGLLPHELDLIDEQIMKMLEVNTLSSDYLRNSLKQKLGLMSGG